MVSVLGPNDQAGPLSFEARAGVSDLPPVLARGPGYGRDPVGKGHAAAGFSAVRAPVVAAVDGADGVVGPAGLADVAAGFAFFFFPAFVFFLADFFLLPAILNDFFFFFDAFFFFFFLPPFFAFFFAMLNLLEGC